MFHKRLTKIYEQGTIENGDLVVYFACADSNHNDLQIDNFLKQELARFGYML
ncbi:MAG: hypothetical protein Q4E15_06515 [Lactobacillus johnsonii]|nr:hypothetical protein [Lactobacillus johnsonii]